MRTWKKHHLAAVPLVALAVVLAASVFASETTQQVLDDARAAAEQGDDEALRQLISSRRLRLFDVLDKLLQTGDDADSRLAARMAELYAEVHEDDALVRRLRLFEAWSAEQRAEFAEAVEKAKEGVRASQEGRILDSREVVLAALESFERLGDTRYQARCLFGVGNTHVKRGELTAGLEWYERALEMARKAGDPEIVGRIESNRGVAHIYQGEYEAAREPLQTALALNRELGRREGERAALLNLGNVASALGNLEEAEELYLAVLEIAKETNDAGSRYMAWANLADIYGGRKDAAPQEDALSRAMEAARESGNPAWVAAAAMDLADTTWRRGDRERAREWLDQAAQASAATEIPEVHGKVAILSAGFALASGDFMGSLRLLDQAEAAIQGDERPLLTWMIQVNRSVNRFALGDYQQAFAAAREALEIAQKSNDYSNSADTHRLLAVHSLTVGEHELALDHVNAAIHDYTKVGDVRGRGATLHVLGALHHRLGDPAAALEALLTAKELVDPEAWASKHAEILLALARVESSQGEDGMNSALARLAEAKRFGERTGDPQLTLLTAVMEAELRLERNETAAARRALNAIREMDPNMLDVREVWRIHYVDGKVHEAEGHLDRARVAYRSAVEEVERLRSGVRATPWKAAMLSRRIDPYHSLFLLHSKEGRTEEAYSVARMAKARTFVERLDVAAFEDFPEIQRPLPAVLIPEEIAPLASLRAALRRGEALLDFFVEKDAVFVFVLRPTGLSVKRIELRREELLDLVEVARRPGRPSAEDEPVTRAFEDSMARLGQALLEPLAPELRSVDRLFVVPNEELHQVPFAALKLDGKLLMRERAISVLPAAEVLLSARRRLETAAQPALVVGDPAAGPDFERLPGAAREARYVAGILGKSVTLLTGELALESVARAKATQAGIIHIAAHARVDPLFPANSFVALTPGEGEDGRWTAEEVATGKIRASLVTLSGCRTALEADIVGAAGVADEREGLVRAFFKAGAGLIVANLWEMDDSVAARVLPELYRRMEHSNPLQALSALQQDMIGGEFRGTDGQSLAHPFHWAGLVAYGPGLVPPESKRAR